MAIDYCNKCSREIYYNGVIIAIFNPKGYVETTTICEECYSKINGRMDDLLNEKEESQ